MQNQNTYSDMFAIPLIQVLNHPLFEQKQVQVSVKRLDLIHPLIHGNKWYKLKYNLAAAQQQGKTCIETFGGAFSNHIYATAAAGKLFGFQTIGNIRGEEHLPLNPLLRFATTQGMQIRYKDRTTYRQQSKPTAQSNLLENSEHYFLPEGGANELAVKGCQEIAEGLETFDVVCCACGTGSTLAGISAGLPPHTQKIGFAVLKGGNFLYKDIAQWTKATENLQIMTAYHAGGYAKHTSTLLQFIADFKQNFQIPIEYVYTGKLFFGLFDLIQNDFFKPKTNIVVVHTGGVYE